MARRSFGLTVQRERVTLQAFGLVENVICDVNPDDCCDGTGTGSGAEECCPEGGELASLEFQAEGPIGAACGVCTVSGVLTIDGDTRTWTNDGEIGASDCEGETQLSLSLYCAGGEYRFSGVVGSSDAPAVFFDVSAEVDFDTDLLTANVTIPDCGSLTIACDQPCVGIASYNCVDGACVGEAGSEGEYATLSACEEACAAAQWYCMEPPEGTIATACCPDTLLPEILYVTFSNASAEVAGLEGFTGTYTYNMGVSGWRNSALALPIDGDPVVDTKLVCVAGEWDFDMGPPCFGTTASVTAVCGGDVVATGTMNVGGVGCGTGAGTVDFTITRAP
jgi:hypothetical protein